MAKMRQRSGISSPFTSFVMQKDKLGDFRKLRYIFRDMVADFGMVLVFFPFFRRKRAWFLQDLFR
jgi:hypothetical protein